MSQRRKLTRLFIFNALLLAACFAVLEWSVRRSSGPEGPTRIPNPVMLDRLVVHDPAQPAPDISFRLLEGGTTRALKHGMGQYQIINFWATWCAPCLSELPSLERLKDLRGADIAVYAVAMDDGITPEDLAAFLNAKKLRRDVAGYYDADGQIALRVNLRGYPTTWVIDPGGRIVAELAGEADWASPEVLAVLDDMMKR